VGGAQHPTGAIVWVQARRRNNTLEE